jgi:hypothetical protein
MPYRTSRKIFIIARLINIRFNNEKFQKPMAMKKIFYDIDD